MTRANYHAHPFTTTHRFATPSLAHCCVSCYFRLSFSANQHMSPRHLWAYSSCNLNPVPEDRRRPPQTARRGNDHAQRLYIHLSACSLAGISIFIVTFRNSFFWVPRTGWHGIPSDKHPALLLIPRIRTTQHTHAYTPSGQRHSASHTSHVTNYPGEPGGKHVTVTRGLGIISSPFSLAKYDSVGQFLPACLPFLLACAALCLSLLACHLPRLSAGLKFRP